MYLGHTAVDVLGLVDKHYTTVSSSNPETLRAKIRAEVEKDMRESITKEVMDNLRNPESSAAADRSISTVPGNPEAPGQSKALTEDEFAKLSKGQRAALLRGESI